MSVASESVNVMSPEQSTRATRPFYWSVRREIWEHRSIYIAPLVVAVLVLFGFLIRVIHLPETMRMLAMLKPGHGKTHRAYLWSYGSTQFDPMVVEAFEAALRDYRAPTAAA